MKQEFHKPLRVLVLGLSLTLGACAMDSYTQLKHDMREGSRKVFGVDLDDGPTQNLAAYDEDAKPVLDNAKGEFRFDWNPDLQYLFAPDSAEGARRVVAVRTKWVVNYPLVAPDRPLGWLEWCGMLYTAKPRAGSETDFFGTHVCVHDPRHYFTWPNPYVDSALLIRDLPGLVATHGPFVPLATLEAQWAEAEKAGDTARLQADSAKFLALPMNYSPLVKRAWEQNTDYVANLEHVRRRDAADAAEAVKRREAAKIAEAEEAAEVYPNAYFHHRFGAEIDAFVTTFDDRPAAELAELRAMSLREWFEWYHRFAAGLSDLRRLRDDPAYAGLLPRAEARDALMRPLLARAFADLRADAEARNLPATAAAYQALQVDTAHEGEASIWFGGIFDAAKARIAALAQELLPLWLPAGTKVAVDDYSLEYNDVQAQLRRGWRETFFAHAARKEPPPQAVVLRLADPVYTLTELPPETRTDTWDNSRTVEEEGAPLEVGPLRARLLAQLEDIDIRAGVHLNRLAETPGDRGSPIWVENPDHKGWLIQKAGERTAAANWRQMDAEYELRQLRDERLAVMAQLQQIASARGPKRTRLIHNIVETRVDVHAWKVQAWRDVTFDDPVGGPRKGVLTVSRGDEERHNPAIPQPWKTRAEVEASALRHLNDELSDWLVAQLPVVLAPRLAQRLAATKDPREARLLKFYFGAAPQPSLWDALEPRPVPQKSP